MLPRFEEPKIEVIKFKIADEITMTLSEILGGEDDTVVLPDVGME